jgi:hypothetical protein
METVMMQDERVDARKLPIMRTLARFHECDAAMIYDRVEGSELEVRDTLSEMVSLDEVEPSPNGDEKFSLTARGWELYLKALGSLYELPE